MITPNPTISKERIVMTIKSDTVEEMYMGREFRTRSVLILKTQDHVSKMLIS